MDKRITRKKAIRQKCLDCCCGSAPEVRRCTVTSCSLHPFRMGREERAENSAVANENEEKD